MNTDGTYLSIQQQYFIVNANGPGTNYPYRIYVTTIEPAGAPIGSIWINPFV
jgi:hypothetical protein